MKEQKTNQENYRIFRYWNNGFKYKFKRETIIHVTEEDLK